MSPQPWPRRPHTLQGAWEAIEDLRDRYDDMQVADEVAAAVRLEIERHHMFGFTVVQKAAGATLGLVVLVASALQIAAALGWL